LFVIGCLLLVVCYWLFVGCYWLLVIGGALSEASSASVGEGLFVIGCYWLLVVSC